MGKRLQILQEAVPSLRRIAVLRTPIRWAPQFFTALFAEMAKERGDALLVWGNPNIRVFFERIQELTIRHRLPAMHELSLYVRQGGLMAYGPKGDDVLRQAATYVDKIFKGANPVIFRSGSRRRSSWSSTSRLRKRSGSRFRSRSWFEPTR
jgi:putative ABC transport system substrate-binding protein